MAPIATHTMTETAPASLKLRGPSPPDAESVARNQLPGPLSNMGLIEKYPHFETTPAIGREFKSDLQLDELLKADNSEALIKDLAYMISRRGVCFFRDQNISQDDMMKLAEAIGVASGRPSGSKMCIHPVSENTPETGTRTMLISAERQNKGGGIRRIHDDLSRWASVAWHSDVSFEHVPSDYSMLKINILPEAGGDTMWASTSDVLDKMSPSFRDYLETLTATHDASFFHAEAAQHGITIDKDRQRGNPLNTGDHLTASHPLIRTNPVTGWKSMYVNKGFFGRIDGVSRDESDIIAKYCFDLINNNMDIQCRFKWEKGSVALWDNRCTWHSALFDYNEERAGERASSIGEKPYLDPSSQYKSEALKAEGKKW